MSIHAFDVCTLRYWVTQNNKKNRIKRSLLTRITSPVHRPSSLCLLNVYDLYNRLTRELLVGGGCSFSLLMAHKRMLLDTQSQKPIISGPKEGHSLYNKRSMESSEKWNKYLYQEILFKLKVCPSARNNGNPLLDHHQEATQHVINEKRRTSFSLWQLCHPTKQFFLCGIIIGNDKWSLVERNRHMVQDGSYLLDATINKLFSVGHWTDNR